MRVRIYFAVAFFFEVLLAAYLGLSSMLAIPGVDDKVLHFLVFFLLTVTFYWILDTTRRRSLNLTLLCVTVGFGLASEVLQGLLPNGRQFDPRDIGANLVGSLIGLGLCSLYHKRMLDRRRAMKGYGVVPQDGQDEDVELGDSGLEHGTVEAGEAWDNMDGEETTETEGRPTPSSSSAGGEATDGKK